MVEIRYGEHYEVADLAGRSVAEVRGLYKSAFSIPDRTKASLNGKGIKSKLEPERILNEDDKLSFEEKSRKGLVLLGTFLFVLAVTGGLFAYTYTTSSITLSLTAATADFATVAENTTCNITWRPFGSYRGAIPGGDTAYSNLFDITPAVNYTGDLEVDVYISNLDELSKNYSVYLMRLTLVDSANQTVDAQMAEKPLTLKNGVVQFYWPSDNFTPGDTYYIRSEGGSYYGLPWIGTNWATTYNPILFCQVKQAGITPTP